MGKEPEDFLIVHRDVHGAPDYIYPYESRVSACVVTSINVTRGYLCNATVRAALVSFGEALDQTIPNPWYRNPVTGYGSPKSAVLGFICLVLEEFFITCIEDSMTNAKELGCMAPCEWDGLFNPRDHCISINGPRIKDMIAAATRAMNTWGRSDHDLRPIQTFTFILANTFFHEICHLLVMFLTKGRTMTPAHFKPEVKYLKYSKEYNGESGRYMETVLFGGTIEIHRDPAQDDSQPGIPCICNNSGIRRISEATINATCRHQYVFPYGFEGPPLPLDKLDQLGKNHDPVTLTNPMRWSIMQQFRIYRHTVRVPPGAPPYQPPFDPYSPSLNPETHRQIAPVLVPWVTPAMLSPGDLFAGTPWAGRML